VTVRSTKLGAIGGADPGWWFLYVCPNGWRTIVKDIRFDNAGQPPTTLTIIVQDQAQNINLNIVGEIMDANSHSFWVGWLVMDAGESIVVNSSAANFNCWISGTLLQLTGAEAPILTPTPAGPFPSPPGG
jgi:hypothetical protein